MPKAFDKLVAKLKKRSDVKNPHALAAWIVRNKRGESDTMEKPSSDLIEQVAYGEDPWRLVHQLTELHDPYDESSFQDGLKKVGDMLVKCCRQLDDLRTMIGLPTDKAKQLDEATVKCSDAVKSVKVMLHDSMNPTAPDAEDDDGRALQSPPPEEDDEPSVVIDPLKSTDKSDDDKDKKEGKRRRR